MRNDHKKFRFEPFINSAVKEEPIILGPIPTYFEEDIVKTERISFQNGFYEGINQGKLEAQIITSHKQISTISSILEKINNAIEESMLIQQQNEEIIKAVVAKLTIALFNKMLPIYIKNHGATEISLRINRAVSHLIDKQDIKITLNPRLLPEIKQRLSPLSQIVNITFEEDTSMQELDSHIEWHNGGFMWSQDKMLSTIQEFLDNWSE